MKGIVRILAFFAKELAEVRRQPRLVLSLVLGPFLILLIFGLGYVGEQPKLRTVLVVPPGTENDPRIKTLTDNLGAAFTMVSITSDEAQARELLRRDEADIIEIVPVDVDQLFGRQQQSPITVLYNEVDPLQEQWITYLTYVQVKELNTALLVNLVNTGKAEGDVGEYIRDARQQVATIRTGLGVATSEESRAALRQLRTNNSLLLAALALADGGSNAQAQQGVQQIQADLQAIETGLSSGDVPAQQERLTLVDTRLGELETIASQLRTVPAEVLVSPLRPDPRNIAEISYKPDYITFYTPGVLALLLQHIAVTLAALSLVRENLLGSVELFRVAPSSSLQILLGKYMGYILFSAIIAAALTALLTANIALGTVGGFPMSLGLGVPFVGNVWWFAGSMLLLIVASLGVGFLISAVSQSESQAVQLSMIALLGSVFFSGFFLPLANFVEPVRWLANILPITHGNRAFQDIMLRGRLPSDISWAWLSGIALVCFMLSWFLWRRNIRRS